MAMLFQQNGVWPVIVARQYDIEVIDHQTLHQSCVDPSCGVMLELVHLQDMDTYRLWYGGYCGKCGAEQDVELDDDTLQCKTCETPLVFDSTDDEDYYDVRPMHCPRCHPAEETTQP